MDEKSSSPYPTMLAESKKSSSKESDNQLKRQDFWNGTLVEDYNFLMSEELICRCKNSLGEPFTSLNDLSVHHVSYNEFEKQYGELAHWCEKIYETITKISSNALARYLRQKYYEELYEQGLMRQRLFSQYAEKLIERFPDLKLNISEKISRINRQWTFLESRFIDYLDEDFDRLLQDLHNELFLFEQWLSQTEEHLWRFDSIRTDDISFEDFQLKLHQHTKLQDEIKSRNSRVSSIIEICERLQNDYEERAEEVPFHLASDLENRWHQTWINSVEIQCKLEERLKIFRNTTSLHLIVDNNNEEEEDGDEDDIIPFSSSEYEKIPLTPSNSSIDSLNSSSIPSRKRRRSATASSKPSLTQSFHLRRKMAKSKRRMSLNLLPLQSPSTFYYSLTNINEFDEQTISKKPKRTLSKLDVGYESEDETAHSHFIERVRPIFSIKKSQSDYLIGQKTHPTCSSLTHSLPHFERDQLLPSWWRHSITSAYDTCSNPDIDFSIEETKKKTQTKTSLLMYSKKYQRMKYSSQLPSLSSPVSNIKEKSVLHPTSNSYDASAEYTDPDQSENDVDILSSDFNSASPVHHYPNSQFYNRYTTTMTTTTGYSSDIELERTTTPSEMEEQQIVHFGEVSRMKIDRLALPSSVTSDGFDSLNTIVVNEKIDGSEPCWDGYQNPLFYPLNSQDMDSIEMTLKWEDQFLEVDQLNCSSSDDEPRLPEHLHRSFRNIVGSSTSLAGGVATTKQRVDSDSDLDDFNYVLNETEKQLLKARQSLEKKKRQQPYALNDRHLRKYDEVLRTCETNIQCLQQILLNLHRSKNSRLNSLQAIEQLQGYLSGWHDMRQQVNDDRIRARQLLYVSQEIIKLKLRLEEEIARLDSQSHQHPWLDESSLAELMRRIHYELDAEKDSQQKLASYRADILLADEHLSEYRMSHFDGPSSSNIDEHLHSSRLALEQLTDKIEIYQNQLRTLAKMIDSLLSVERQIEQKLNTMEYNNNDQFDLSDLHRWIDQYEQLLIHVNRPMFPTNHLQLKLKAHCQAKVDLYKKVSQEFLRKSQTKHVSFDGFINSNNNNSSRINTSSSSSSSTPQQYSTDPQHHLSQTRSSMNKYRRTETRKTSDETSHRASNQQSSTSSYISDDCKVLYIETVIEVAKPVFYERNTDTSTTSNTEYHHHQQQQQQQQQRHAPVSTEGSERNVSHLYTSTEQRHESSDDEYNKPVNSPPSSRLHHSQQMDSGIEYDQTSPPASSSSSSTLFNQQTLNTPLLSEKRLHIPSPTRLDANLDQSSSVRRRRLRPLDDVCDPLPFTSFAERSHLDSYWNRFKQTWFRCLLLGFLMLLLLFVVYFSRLDTCSRTTLIRSVCQKILCVENEGLPTI